MSKRWINVGLLVCITFLFSACSDSYKRGQTVWIDLPKEGYAIAKVIRMKNDKVRLRVIKLSTTSKGRLVRSLQRKRVLIASSLLQPVKQGRAKWKERRAKRHARRLEAMLDMMTSKNQYKGKAKYKKKALRFKIKISKFNNKSGHFTGRMTWPQRKGTVNRIKGQLNKKSLSINFKEVAVIKKGNWRLGGEYKFSMASDKKMKGTMLYRVFVFPVKRPASIALAN